MAKKKAKRSTPAETLRHAVDQTFQAAAGQAQTTRDRAQELVDELAHTAGRLRGALEELRPPGGDDVRSLQTELQALERRVGALEQRVGALPGGKRRSTSRRSPSPRAGGSSRGAGRSGGR
jgi:polyhydroxyalkanoate synthesis regulator phasin